MTKTGWFPIINYCCFCAWCSNYFVFFSYFIYFISVLQGPNAGPELLDVYFCVFRATWLGSVLQEVPLRITWAAACMSNTVKKIRLARKKTKKIIEKKRRKIQAKWNLISSIREVQRFSGQEKIGTRSEFIMMGVLSQPRFFFWCFPASPPTWNNQNIPFFYFAQNKTLELKNILFLPMLRASADVFFFLYVYFVCC